MAGQIIIGDPIDQTPQSRANRRALDQLDYRAQASGVDGLITEHAFIPHNPRQLSRTQRHDYDTAWFCAHSLRQAVVQRP